MSTKPVMRGLLATRIKRHIIIGCTFAVATAVCYKVFVTDPRKKATAEFYSTYDPYADFERMKKTGNYFQAVSQE